MNDTTRLGLTIGPLQYWWPREATLRFYADLAESAADTIVLGEVTCSRRNEFSLSDWVALARDLQSCGKTVRLATLPLLMSEAELRTMRRIAEQGEFAVEAGDAATLHAWARQPHEQRPPLVLGPHLNIYSAEALQEHLQLGAAAADEAGGSQVQAWVPPLELALDAVARVANAAQLAQRQQPQLDIELFAFGRMPLAFSARCFTARHHRLAKDDCNFRCRDDADGLLLSSSEGEPFLALNGISTQSAALHCLLGREDIAAVHDAGVTRLRLSPCSRGFDEVLAQFDAVYNKGADAAQAGAALAALPLPGRLVHGFAHRQPGMQPLILAREALHA